MIFSSLAEQYYDWLYEKCVRWNGSPGTSHFTGS